MTATPPTVEEEIARCAAVAAEHGLVLPEVPFADDTPEIVRPAAVLFAALSAKLTGYGLDPMPLLADARHSATLAALEDWTRRVAVALTVPDDRRLPVEPIDPGLVELDALRRLEATLVSLIDEVERQARFAKLATASRADLRELARRAAQDGGSKSR